MTIRPTHLISRAPLRSLVLPLALAGAVALGACGNAATASPAAAPTATIAPATGSSDQASTPVTATGSAASGSPAASTAPAQKVNANTASQAEIQQALEAAGVPNAARWAREVEEYRPYPTNDPSFAKLRQELAKYNPAPGVVDQIVATVTL
jgi:hypothetical protein